MIVLIYLDSLIFLITMTASMCSKFLAEACSGTIVEYVTFLGPLCLANISFFSFIYVRDVGHDQFVS
jgi:hypothetical protein